MGVVDRIIDGSHREDRGYKTPCRVFDGKKDERGYGLVGHHNGSGLAHVRVYVERVGPVPPGLELHHLCDQTDCNDETHLAPVTHRENVLLGGSPAAEQARRLVCIHGHRLEGKNLYVYPSGKRACRACQRAHCRRQHERRTA